MDSARLSFNLSMITLYDYIKDRKQRPKINGYFSSNCSGSLDNEIIELFR